MAFVTGPFVWRFMVYRWRYIVRDPQWRYTIAQFAVKSPTRFHTKASSNLPVEPSNLRPKCHTSDFHRSQEQMLSGLCIFTDHHDAKFTNCHRLSEQTLGRECQTVLNEDLSCCRPKDKQSNPFNENRLDL